MSYKATCSVQKEVMLTWVGVVGRWWRGSGSGGRRGRCRTFVADVAADVAQVEVGVASTDELDAHLQHVLERHKRLEVDRLPVAAVRLVMDQVILKTSRVVFNFCVRVIQARHVLQAGVSVLQLTNCVKATLFDLMTSTAILSGPFTWNLSPFNLNKNICLFRLNFTCNFVFKNIIDRLLTGRAGFRCGFRSRSMWRRTAAFRCWSRTGRCVASARSRAGARSRRRSTAASRGSCSRAMPHLKSKIRVMEIFF